ncbi:hypothetical protein AWW68_05735 [Roseivirga spongicola]|uniref:Aminoglycoside phosphotransferase domain-containing protein n=1 Tax=Roseivirga spongicola TaxID=333140 RepID=A0A150XHT5_9BACT|nr:MULTISPECIES: aminoglycoside phosphotransferase family protein [Roseivirga]KYG78266.1 hypothetical protein AWW68_05735 [Roseivirga spongicola]MBO6660907.1 aminoglycoside phosphotransferase family protein [Roseivirga sp.]MBO6761207.1 aminoglycoside phosphotransferase family protein [Roseivirga sp.]MBO6909109.1 aminoglycoside phosphotransferase family protein [Roseivirga sp.]
MLIAAKALELYNIKGAIDSVAPFGLGHINDSFVVMAEGKKYLLQRLNTAVFPKPEVVENNLRRILSLAPELFAHHVLGKNGKYHQFDGESFWRLQEFVADSYAPEKLGLNELEEIAKGYGRFTASFSAENLSDYVEAIPKFLDLTHRLNQFEEALRKDKAGRKSKVSSEIEAVLSFQWVEDRFNNLVEAGLPHRVCHNDTKAANCLLAQPSGQFLKVVDLDTVGPGYAMFDMGDMLRSMLFNIPENDSNLSGLAFDNKRFETILNSYLKECSHALTPVEIETLPLGGLCMTYITAVRFLTDYLNGDVYYKVTFEGENLVRARNQLKILELMSEAIA